MQTSANPCDFICFANGRMFLVECKAHKGASIPLTAIRQYERLLQFKICKDTYPGVLVWFSEKDTVVWVPITELEKIVADGHKSVQLKMLAEKSYNLIQVPSVKKRTFMDSDYSVLMEI